MKPSFAFFVIITLTCTRVLAGQQSPAIDSLKKQIAPAVLYPDTNAVNRLNQLAEAYFESQPDSTVYYANEAIRIAKQIDYKKGMAAAYIQLALVNTFKSQYQASQSNFNKAAQLYQQVNNQAGVSEAYIGLGRVQDYLGNYDSAIAVFNRALSIRQKLRNRLDIAHCYAIMGITYDNKGELSKALDYYFKSLKIDIEYKDELAEADNYNNIGVVLQHLELNDKALIYFDKALKIWKRQNDLQGISTIYQNVGEVLMDNKDYKAAFAHFRQASAIYHKLGDQEGISLIYYNFGLYHYYTKQPDSAIYFLNLSLQSASKNQIKYNKAYAYLGLAMVYNLTTNYKKALSNALLAQTMANDLGSINAKADATLQVSKAFAGLKQFEKAYGQHQLYVALTDSLKNSESVQKLVSYNMALDFEKSQAAAVRLQQQKEVYLQQKITQKTTANLIYAAIIVIMATMLVFYYNAKRKQLKAYKLITQKNNEVQKQQADLRVQAGKLNELNILKDRLISVLAHDLRAPLSTLRGMFSLITTKDISQAEFSDMVPVVYGKLRHTSDFLDTLLFWINSQVDDVIITTKSFCLCDLVKQELVYLEDQLKRKNITPVNTVYSGHIVLADPNSIRIVIHNYLTNAIKFSHENSIIEISAKIIDGEKIDFSVKDHGMGLTPQQLNSLFKSKLISSPGTLNEVGTGMGLVFCKDLIEKYDGTIWAKSTLGHGAEFGFTLAADTEQIKKAKSVVPPSEIENP
ncbi:sensor histidine kinase [Inquilinus sp. KBS0705]|nr:sensor histidine kinase [Inquilinus sp. KBS0705]